MFFFHSEADVVGDSRTQSMKKGTQGNMPFDETVLLCRVAAVIGSNLNNHSTIQSELGVCH
jgi:hypothetical protein